MLKLRRAVVREVLADAGAVEQSLVVELADAPARRRAAIADTALVGRAEVGDEVIVNVQALDLGLGSGGFSHRARDPPARPASRGPRRRARHEAHLPQPAARGEAARAAGAAAPATAQARPPTRAR